MARTQPEVQTSDVQLKDKRPANGSEEAPATTPNAIDVDAVKVTSKETCVEQEPQSKDDTVSNNAEIPSEDLSGNDAITLKDVQVMVEKRPSQREGEPTVYETASIPEMKLPAKPTLDDVREALLACELGAADRDIFFPAWTKSLYISWVEGKKEGESKGAVTDPETVENEEQLRSVVQRELENPGTLCLRLQECRNARYSRKREKRPQLNSSQGKTGQKNKQFPEGILPEDFQKMGMGPGMFIGQQLAYSVYNGSGMKHRGEGMSPVYFDRPYPVAYSPVFNGCQPYPVNAQYGEYAYMQPYVSLVPVMYSQPNSHN